MCRLALSHPPVKRYLEILVECGLMAAKNEC